MATHFNILAWRIPMDRGAWGATVHGVARSDTTEVTQHTVMHQGLGDLQEEYEAYGWVLGRILMCSEGSLLNSDPAPTA